MKTNTLSISKCPFCKENFRPKRTNQTYCSYECSYTAYNRRKSERQKEARKTLNKILKNWQLLFDIDQSPQFPDNVVPVEFLIERGYSTGYITHRGTDEEDGQQVVCICEFAIKSAGANYEITKIEADEV